MDESNRRQVFELLLDLVRREGVTMILATHDQALAGQCDRVCVVKDGQVVQSKDGR